MAETRKMTRTPKTSKAKPVDEYGHLQPQAPELEEAVLGALMIEKDAYSLVSEILRPESFYERRHQLIYSAITSLALRQQPVDILTVAEQLRSTGELEDAGGPFYITQLSGKVASSAPSKSGGTNGRAEWSGKRFPCIGQNDLGLAKFRPGDYCRPSRYG